LPRSAPDALRYEPGVFVQQTAHGQGSAFIRGRTGQQTVLMFDGIRLNTSTWRQGPNQYFFTVDSHSIHHIDVIRGGASTRFGSDAIGGVIEAHPLEPRLTLGREGPVLLPRTMVRYASADQEFGQRFQLDAQVDPSLRALAGVGYRRVGQLERGGPVRSPTTGEIPQVPAFESDGRTQLGTGFDELTGDLRVVRQLGDDTRVVAATYAYRQYDSPRTDQCPPPFAPRDECMKYDEQFRTLAYMAIDGRYGGLARTLRAAVSIQRQHERRTRVRPASFVENGGRDDVNTFGAMLRATSDDTTVGANGRARLTYGGDVYHDRVDSTAWTVFTDLPRVIPSSRGQYLNDAHYTQGGVFVEPSFDLGTTLTVRAGSRGGGAQAFAPSDPESGTSGIDRGWTSLVGYGGVIVRPVAPLSAILNVDRSFRAPNLDDLTSRQQTGPGFQFENPNLRPEVALTFESGLRWRDQALEAEAWVFRSLVDEAIERVLRTSADCPAATPQCQASWSRFQLVNASGTAVVEGVELAARLALPSDFVAQASLSATRGETDNSQQRPTDPTLPYEERVPLSRIPPVHGSGELRWDPDGGVYAGASVRWALLQDKLAPSDLSDARIPKGGTPGFLVVDLTAGYRFERELVFNIVLENLGDTAYRYHGSSVNGPGRGVIVNMEAGL
jgi:iron complex outermembrane receptor protein/hemoglobin/transferrin/lactoferrin receptor protein